MLIDQECTRGIIPLKPYLDTVGKLTIGVGRNLDDKGLSRNEALDLLQNDINDAIEDVRHCCSIYDELSRPRQLVLISMAFNMGREGLSRFIRFLDALHANDWERAADEMMRSKWATQVGTRATTLAAMMRSNTSEWI